MFVCDNTAKVLCDLRSVCSISLKKINILFIYGAVCRNIPSRGSGSSF